MRSLTKNKQKFIAYNNFRKNIFSELTPKDSDVILYLLPWLLSINHSACPGYLPQTKSHFKIYNIDNDEKIRSMESGFKKKFNIKKTDSLLKVSPKYYSIEGVYTIGSIGTVGQTSGSDCDIWICYNKKQYNKTAWENLNKKLNLIKDWIDSNIKIPVFFFISDINDIKIGHFGQLDIESSGSLQKNVLKDEFYRTFILICGKIPLWCVCYNPDNVLSYDQIASTLEKKKVLYGLYDFVDLGNLEIIEQDEFFGAGLWQLNKSLQKPLKSIIKMLLLRLFIDVSNEKLISHQFRENILSDKSNNFTDPLIFSMNFILNYYKNTEKQKTLDFVNICFYLRCELNPKIKTYSLKVKLYEKLLKDFPINKILRIKLENFASWEYQSQIEMGDKLFKFLIQIFREISDIYKQRPSRIDKKELTILSRKIAAYYQKKTSKVNLLLNPSKILNISDITLILKGNVWSAYINNNNSNDNNSLISSTNIINIIAFLVWNNIFSSSTLRMKPNHSSVTLQEIINLGICIRNQFGNYTILQNELSDYIEKEKVVKLLVVLSFEHSPWEKNINDFCVIYKNNWGELFVKKIKSSFKLAAFIKKINHKYRNTEINYYLQRNCTFYEKIIERTKKLIFLSLNI